MQMTLFRQEALVTSLELFLPTRSTFKSTLVSVPVSCWLLVADSYSRIISFSNEIRRLSMILFGRGVGGVGGEGGEGW